MLKRQAVELVTILCYYSYTSVLHYRSQLIMIYPQKYFHSLQFKQFLVIDNALAFIDYATNIVIPNYNI